MSKSGCWACVVPKRRRLKSDKKVNSRGREQGLREGDRLVSVNGRAAMTHADVQRVLKETLSGVELQIERSSGSLEKNGYYGPQNGDRRPEIIVNALEEEGNPAGSWSTDSTSTGSTTIHISSLPSADTAHSDEVWSPSSKRANLRLNIQPSNPPPVVNNSFAPAVNNSDSQFEEEEEKSPVWQPFGAPYDGRQFRRVKLDVKSTTMATNAEIQNESKKADASSITNVTRSESPKSPKKVAAEPPTSVTDTKPSIENDADSHHTTSAIFTKTGWSSHLPPSQSPTITLLQKAREGQIPKGAVYIEEKSESTPIPKNALLIDQKVTIEGDKIHTDSYYAVPAVTSSESTMHTIKAPSKYDGIGPTEYGIPVGLRTGVKEEYASDWYKSMYKSLHRQKFPNDTHQGVHLGGYMSEPELERKDKLKVKYSAEHRRKPEKTAAYISESPDKARVLSDSSVVRQEPRREVYRVEPRSIADYEPGRSSLAEREFQKQQEHFGGSSPRPHQSLSRRWPNVLLTDGYESDSTLIRKTGRNLEVEPDQQKAWYKEVQKGGEIPLIGLRKTVPEKPTASPHQFQETEVNIHYRSPIRNLEKELIEEEELRKRQEESMRKFYEDERRKKHQQELAEIEMRRHSDYFTPSQKSPIPLNRYDNPFETTYTHLITTGLSGSPVPKTMARALYPFTAQTTKELSLNKGDIVYVNKQVDKNWFEGEHHGLIGIFPVAYVEVIPNERAHLQPRKAMEGEALVKYNFRAKTPVELSLFKGEKVVLIRRIDHNWLEGRLGMKKGIFPVSYVEILQEPGEILLGTRAISPKPPASPVFSSIISGSPPKPSEGPTFNTGLRPLQNKPPFHMDRSETKSSLTQSLHIDTYNEPIPYRSLYAYTPQNDDELELKEGDTVYVMEKCDDGWYVGTSLRTGLFGTFPGNYVERI